MDTTPLTLAIAAGLLAALYWWRYCHAGPSWSKSVVKTASVLLLALSAWAAGGPGLLLVALLLCALGDYLLSRPTEGEFMAGVGAFAAGHVAYVVLFLAQGGAQPLSPWLTAALLLLGVVMATILWRRAGALRGPVMVYIPVILSMGLAAQTLPASGALALALPAALLFIASDFILSHEMFVLPETHPLRRFTPFAVWPTYWGAQSLFTLAFALL
ncbi:lysoplasmalogenase [Marimonas lutisalis]|uniref:lysoplasmalogenase n=1 Tax=Marimonas lutisalis TaxID=2545756 RepID=UPI0018763835|nr:lysoplasmalogenase [Marimonas lutisalis]